MRTMCDVLCNSGCTKFMQSDVTLGKVIEFLERWGMILGISTKMKNGFKTPHSFRGYYNELAFEPTIDISIKDMIEECKKAIGTTYQGWKGGEYKMSKDTPVWIAQTGEVGRSIECLLTSWVVDYLRSN